MEDFVVFIVLFLFIAVLVGLGFGVWNAHDRIDIARHRLNDVESLALLLRRRLDTAADTNEDEDEDEEGDGESGPVFCPTHCITDNGREVFVRKSRPGYGMDLRGKTYPLFIKPGQSDYSVKRV